VRTLLFTDVVSGDGTAWDSAVASICADVYTFRQLLNNLYHVKRTVCPTTHAHNLIMPTQSLIKRMLNENPDADNTALLRLVRECAADFKHFLFVKDWTRGVLIRSVLMQASHCPSHSMSWRVWMRDGVTCILSIATDPNLPKQVHVIVRCWLEWPKRR
jgi:hypothetical protein